VKQALGLLAFWNMEGLQADIPLERKEEQFTAAKQGANESSCHQDSFSHFYPSLPFFLATHMGYLIFSLQKA
jgi:hypothetical protein